MDSTVTITPTAAIEQLLSALAIAFEKKPDRNWCAEMKLANQGDDVPWVQVTGAQINFYYPFDTSPVERLVHLKVPPLPGMVCDEWSSKQFATLELVAAGDIQWLSRFIDSLFVHLYGCKQPYELETEIAEI